MALTDDAHRLISEHFTDRPTKLAIDATCGNGFDTQFLIELGFSKVISFDVQEVAIKATANRLKQLGLNNAELVLSSHELIHHHVNAEVDCVMFNFGYLPSGDKTITTDANSSLKAISIACELLSPSGIITLMCYPGHSAGAIEAKAITHWFDTLGKGWSVETHLAVSPKVTAPILYLLKRVV